MKLKFNKTEHELSFLSGTQIKAIAEKYNLKTEIISDSGLTSNTIYILRKS